MEERDPQSRYDGGWEEAVESGHGLAELSLDPPHPYNRADHYTPEPRWATRHELVSEPFNDEVVAHEERGAVTSADVPWIDQPRRTVSRPKAVRTARRGKSPRDTVLAEEDAWYTGSTPLPHPVPGPKTQRGTKDRGGSAPAVLSTKWSAKQLRDQFIASALDVSIPGLRDLRRKRSAAQQVVKGPQQAIADRMGVPVALLERLNAAESYAMSATHAALAATQNANIHSPARMKGTVRTGSAPLALGVSRQRRSAVATVPTTRPVKYVARRNAPIANACNACGLVVSISGWCACS